jgi:hypothetical protein
MMTTRGRCLVAAVAAAGLAVAGCAAAPRPAPARGVAASSAAPASGVASRLSAPAGAGPAGFVAVGDGPGTAGPWIRLGDAATGAIGRTLVPGTYDGMRAEGAAVGRDGSVWVTYSKGPAARPDGFGPSIFTPGSCGNAIVEWNLRGTAPRAALFLRTGDDVLLGQAVPSPDGRLLAYAEHPCALEFAGLYLRVADVATGRSWTIGQGLPGCHVLTAPAWSGDGTQLLEGYAAANAPYGQPGSAFCTGPGTERLLRLPAAAAQAGAAGQVTSPDGNCQVGSVAALAGGAALALESCGRSQDYARDFAALLVVAPDGRHERTVSLGACSQAGQLAGDASGGSVLVTVTVDCAPATPHPAMTYELLDYSGGRLRLVRAAPASASDPASLAF